MDGSKKAIDPGSAGSGSPRQLLSAFDGVFLMVGMVIGVGIFKAPSVVAGNVASGSEFLLAWLFGGSISLAGALVYAELASRHPDTGGEYAFLSRALGRGTGFLFAWSRITVIQTGAIAAVAFVFGDYASQILPLGTHGSAIYAGTCKRQWRRCWCSGWSASPGAVSWPARLPGPPLARQQRRAAPTGWR